MVDSRRSLTVLSSMALTCECSHGRVERRENGHSSKCSGCCSNYPNPARSLPLPRHRTRASLQKPWSLTVCA